MGRLDYVSKKGVTNIEHAYKRLQILLLHILMTGCPCEGVSRFTNGIESGTIEVIKCKTVPFSCFLFFPCVCVCHVLSSSSLTETWKFDGNLEIWRKPGKPGNLYGNLEIWRKPGNLTETWKTWKFKGILEIWRKPGNLTETWKFDGNLENLKFKGILEIWRKPGNLTETWKFDGNLEIWRKPGKPGNLKESWKFDGNLEIWWKPGNLTETWKFDGNLENLEI